MASVVMATQEPQQQSLSTNPIGTQLWASEPCTACTVIQPTKTFCCSPCIRPLRLPFHLGRRLSLCSAPANNQQNTSREVCITQHLSSAQVTDVITTSLCCKRVSCDKGQGCLTQVSSRAVRENLLVMHSSRDDSVFCTCCRNGVASERRQKNMMQSACLWSVLQSRNAAAWTWHCFEFGGIQICFPLATCDLVLANFKWQFHTRKWHDSWMEGNRFRP